MDIGQAVRRLRNDEKVRREAWIDEEKVISPDEMSDTVLMLTYEDLLADDWETVDG